MAQYDLLLTQNVHVSGIEFSEKYVNLAKGGLLTVDSSRNPVAIAIGVDGQIPVADSSQTGGIRWKDESVISDALVYKGTVGSGGTHEIAAFNSLATYSIGWTYRVITAGTVKGNVCEIGDIITAIVARSGSGQLDSDWTVMQANIDGAVIGPASATDGHVVLFDGVTGKLIKSGGALGTMAFETATNYVLKSLFDAQTILAAVTDNVPAAVTVAEQRIVGRITSGNITGLTGVQVMNVIWVSPPATKSSTGVLGSVSKDDNFFYICTATNIWKRAPIATNW